MEIQKQDPEFGKPQDKEPDFFNKHITRGKREKRKANLQIKRLKKRHLGGSVR